MLGSQQPNANLIARNFVGQQLAHLSLQAGRISGLESLFTVGPLGRHLLGERPFRATGVEFFLQTKVADDSLDAANANQVVGLPELLGDDLGRSLRIQETVPDNLAHHLLGATVVSLWSARFALQGQGAAELQLFEQLKIALLRVAEFLGGPGGAQPLALAFKKHRQFTGDLILIGQEDGTRRTQEPGVRIEPIKHGPGWPKEDQKSNKIWRYS